jgi:hypothetical protein
LNLQVCSLLLDFRFRTKSLDEVQKELQGMCTTEVTSSRFKAVKEIDETRGLKKKDQEKQPE